MYTCVLEGCSSAWGTSDDICNHLKNHKHQVNFLKKHYPNDERVGGMNKREIMARAYEVQKEHERDYNLILVHYDEAKYWELHDRPHDWSEKKAKLAEAKGQSYGQLFGDRKPGAFLHGGSADR